MSAQTYLVGHNVPKQHDVSRINTHAVTLHSILNLVDDRPSGSFNPEDLRDLDDVVRGRLLADDTYSQFQHAATMSMIAAYLG